MRIAFLSDTHLSVPDINSHALFPRKLAELPVREAGRLYHRMVVEVDRAYQTALAWLRANGPWDAIVHLGDIACGYQEKGIAHPLVRSLVERCAADLRSIAPSVHASVGNHDIGYTDVMTNMGGVSRESIEACEQIFGDLFWSFKEEDLLSIGLCTSLARYTGDDPEIKRRSQRQREFLADALDAHKGPWTLLCHSPETATRYLGVITPHVDRLQAWVYGDLHDPRKARLIRNAARLTSLRYGFGSQGHTLRALASRSSLCPSTAPLWWRGYGLLTASWRQGKWSSEEVALDFPEGRDPIPPSTLFRTAWWVFGPKNKRPDTH